LPKRFRVQFPGVGRLLLVLFTTASPLAAVGLTPPGPNQFRQTAIRLSIALDYPEARLIGSARIELENYSSAPASTASFLLNRLMAVTAVRGSGPGRLPFRQSIVAFEDDPMRQVRQVLVTLPTAVAPRARVVVELRYSGYLVGYTETGSLYMQDRIDSAFTILREDAFAFPVVGVPSWQEIRATPRVDFTYDADIVAPAGLSVASAGRLLERRSVLGGTAWHYRGEKAVPFLNLTVAPYRLIETGGIRLFHFPEDSAGGARLLQASQRALDQLGSWFGPLHDPQTLTIMEIPDGWGSQASLTGGIIQTAAAIRSAEHLGEVYHELSHLWNAPDLDRPSPRWNEGFASFMALRLARDLDGWTGLDSTMQASATAIVARLTGSPQASIPMRDYGRTGNTDLSYRVGRLLFYLLERTTSPESFNAIVGGYYHRYAGAGGTTQDFLDLAIAKSSHDLRPLFRDWMQTTNWLGILQREPSLDHLVEAYRTGRSP
jgi:hypothetical protein